MAERKSVQLAFTGVPIGSFSPIYLLEKILSLWISVDGNSLSFFDILGTNLGTKQ